jgi:anaerobic magnesium-protoporphyrin IX monomethyl ester cyclase
LKTHILLVHPLGYTATAAADDVARLTNIMPPIGLISIAAWLDQQGFETTVVDCYAKPGSQGRIQDILQNQRPQFLGLSCTTSSFLDGVQMAEWAKTIVPSIQTVMGGPHISALKAESLRGYPALDFGIAGEGEETFAELAAGGWKNPGTVEGLIWRDPKGTPQFNGPRKTLLELDHLPFPAYEKLDGYPSAYTLPIFNYPRAPNSSCVSSRGCPYACSYCDRSVFGASFRFNSASYMIAHICHLKEKFGVRHINFYDDQFTFNRQRIEEFCNELIKRKLGITYNCAARAEHLDENLLRLMKKSGCWMISLGIETGDQELLEKHRQRPDVDLLAERIHMIHRAGIRMKGLFMMGLPGETEESIQRSMDYAFSLPIDDINLAKFTPFPGAPLYAGIHELGTFDEDWPKLDCMHFQFIPNGMTREQLDKLFTAFYKRHFMRPRVLAGYASMIWKSPDSWKRFWLSCGSFLRFAASNRRLGENENSKG